jgi:hypothetical protein
VVNKHTKKNQDIPGGWIREQSKAPTVQTRAYHTALITEYRHDENVIIVSDGQKPTQ